MKEKRDNSCVMSFLELVVVKEGFVGRQKWHHINNGKEFQTQKTAWIDK